MPVLRPSGSDFTSFVKAAAQYVAPGRTAKVSKSGGVSVALPGLGAIVRASQVGALASPTTSAVVINGVTPPAAVAAAVAAAVIRVLLGIVTTLAGSSRGFADNTGTGASFNLPYGVAVLPNGNIVVADTSNQRIRLVTPLGVVTTLAGQTTGGSTDGTGTAAQFNGPTGVAVLPNGNIVVADRDNHRIRLVTPLGVVTTLAGSGSIAFADGTGAAASFGFPSGVAALPNGNIVVADYENQRIRLVTPDGVVTTLAGSTAAFADGTGAAASFNYPRGVAVLPNGNIVVADTGNHRIRLVTPGGVVTTLAGSGSPAFADGTGAAASFNFPFGVAVDPFTDRVYVGDTFNHRIRLVTPGGVVTTLAGSGSPAFADGTGTGASFNRPRGTAVTPTGEIVVADTSNDRIRVIT